MSLLNYIPNGDYLVPDLKLEDQNTEPLGRYGRLRKTYLEEHRPVIWNTMTLNGTLFTHLREIDKAARRRLEQIMPRLQEEAGVTEELKEKDPLAWTRLMNNLKSQAEETILTELIYI